LVPSADFGYFHAARIELPVGWRADERAGLLRDVDSSQEAHQKLGTRRPSEVRNRTMAGFKTHLTASTLLGAAYGGAAHVYFGVPASSCLLAGGLTSLAGLLPDVDSNSGRPLQEGVAFCAAVVPMMLVDRFAQLGMRPESIVMAGALVYLFVRFFVGEFLRRFTVHRGMLHSLPAAAIFGLLAFLLSCHSDLRLRMFKAGAVTLGYLSHLVLDELYSVGWRWGRPRLKKSFGTALKMFSHNWLATTLTYAVLVVLAYVAISEPGWMDQVRRGKPLDWAQNWLQEKTQDAAEDTAPKPDDAVAKDRDPVFWSPPGTSDPHRGGSRNPSSDSERSSAANRPFRLLR
jgi:membrane-bound metal-dependent hydrolase YbcI (DUF457 family)